MGTADTQLAAVTRDQWDYYLEQYGGLEESLLASTNDRSLITQATESAATQSAVDTAANSRSLGRRGVNLTGAQRGALEKNRSLGDSLTTATAINNARLDQRERNLGVTADLMMQGRGVNSQAYKGLGEVAGMEASRNSFNEQSKAQHKAQGINNAVSLGTTAALLMTL